MTLTRAIVVPCTEHDDPTFIEIVERIINRLVASERPRDVYLVQIDNWFGKRWRGWPAGLASMVWCKMFDSLRLPPFHPHRVLSQCRHQQLDPDQENYSEAQPVDLHQWYRERHRGIRDFSRSGLFVWFSSNTNRNDRASLMAYHIDNDQEKNWYAEFIKRKRWKLGLAEGIANEQVQRLIRPEHVV